MHSNGVPISKNRMCVPEVPAMPLDYKNGDTPAKSCFDKNELDAAAGRVEKSFGFFSRLS
jgi:hypothetical protein